MTKLINFYTKFLLVLGNFNFCMAQNFSVSDVNELFELINKSTIIEEFQLEYNDAFVYKLANRDIVLIPNIGNQGIVFFSEQIFDKMVSEKKFPVKDDESIFVKHKKMIENIELNLEDFTLMLESELDCKIPNLSNKEQVNNFSKIVNDYINKNGFKEIVVPLGIAIGEKLRLRINGKWKIEKVYVLNPYFIPYVIDFNNKEHDFWNFLFEQLDNKNLNMSKFIKF